MKINDLLTEQELNELLQSLAPSKKQPRYKERGQTKKSRTLSSQLSQTNQDIEPLHGPSFKLDNFNLFPLPSGQAIKRIR